ncbi:hypothetical protein SRB5_52570 [Streptomyces sp. RB5]|uniref:FHA domain-containing protein n=1 Tax=Streptomyces smaragdinus TaxID=2585196 RepID=A0A7K0CNQ2_9ACTN|nr:FHA domain-containing protein [Streptomyces smaragdinus]MQY15079.1 hypothetical protein [Streptomyces smaragdinus]
MATCQNGHTSAADDWCEVCGIRMAPPAGPPVAPMTGAPVPPPPPPGPAMGGGYGYPGAGPEPTQQAELCPQCRTPREAMAPFCEECRYNFLTHSPTTYIPTGSAMGMTGGAGYPSRQDGGYTSSRPSQMNRPAEPLQGFPQQDPRGAGPGTGGGDFLLPPPPQDPYAQPPQQPQQPQPPRQPQPDPYAAPQPPQQPQSPLHQAPPQTPLHQQPPQPDPYAPRPQDPYAPPPQQQQPDPYAQGGPGPGQQYAPQAGWVAVVVPDREYFTAMMSRSGPEASGLNLPAYSPEQKIPLQGPQITIGRRRQSTGESPDIDLSRPPEDPGVSHNHAVLVEQPDGSWAVVDQNSTNGTTVNGGAEPIQPYVPVPLQEGDRVHVGAWTTIRLQRG